MPSTFPTSATANETVSFNLRRARAIRGWTQEQAAEKLEPYLGRRLSKASMSAAERFPHGDRVREFTVDELFAFARAFNLPVSYFLLPPSGGTTVADVPMRDYLDLLLAVDPYSLEALTSEMPPDDGKAVRQKYLGRRRTKTYADAFTEDLKPAALFLRELADTIEAGPIATSREEMPFYRWAAQLGMAPPVDKDKEN
jgi:transcriptional regulator with XRE-family HTH domain